jgi:hypothetical protein
VGSREQTSLARLSAELERLADELVRLGGGQAPPAPPPQGRTPADRLRRRLLEARRARGLRQATSPTGSAGRNPSSPITSAATRRLEVSEFIVIARVLGSTPPRSSRSWSEG